MLLSICKYKHLFSTALATNSYFFIKNSFSRTKEMKSNTKKFKKIAKKQKQYSRFSVTNIIFLLIPSFLHVVT